MKDEYVNPLDLAAIREARLKAELAAREVETLQLKCFVRYGLTERDGIDIGTGKITRAMPTSTTEGPDAGEDGK